MPRKPIELSKYFYEYRDGDWDFARARIDAIRFPGGDAARPLNGGKPAPGRGPLHPMGAELDGAPDPTPEQRLVKPDGEGEGEPSATQTRVPPAGGKQAPSTRQLLKAAVQAQGVRISIRG